MSGPGGAIGRGRTAVIGTFALLLTLLAMLLTGPGVSAAPRDAKVRFLHAIPGVGAATLTAGETEVGRGTYAEPTGFATVPAGSLKLRLTADDGVLEAQETLEAGKAYTVIALAQGSSGELRVYPDGAVAPDMARLRLIHAAPELGGPDLSLNGEIVARETTFGQATDYWDLRPGTYRAVLQNPETGNPAVPPRRLSLPAGTASTLVVLGSRGQPVEELLLRDASAAPAAAPQTGLGGLADGTGSVTVALLAALIAGAGGGLAFLATGRLRAARARGRGV